MSDQVYHAEAFERTGCGPGKRLAVGNFNDTKLNFVSTTEIPAGTKIQIRYKNFRKTVYNIDCDITQVERNNGSKVHLLIQR